MDRIIEVDRVARQLGRRLRVRVTLTPGNRSACDIAAGMI